MQFLDPHADRRQQSLKAIGEPGARHQGKCIQAASLDIRLKKPWRWTMVTLDLPRIRTDRRVTKGFVMGHTGIGEGDRATGNWHGRRAIIPTYDGAHSSIRIASESLWMPENVNRNFDEMARLIEIVGAKKRHSRVLFDRRDSPDQSATTNERIRIRSEDLFSIGDRVSLVVPNCLTNRQFSGALNEKNPSSLTFRGVCDDVAKAYD